MSRTPTQKHRMVSALKSSVRRGDGVRRRLAPWAALALAAAWCGPAYAIDIVAIEEHWELTVGEPDVSSSGPQICMMMSPTGGLDGNYFMFTLNHRSHPEYSSGGMQVQYWNGESLVDSKEGSTDQMLNHEGEVVTWTQKMTVQNGWLTFSVREGASESFGYFGGHGRLKFTVGTSLESLNGYKPALSLEESGVSFAGNRVRSLVLTKLRWWDSAGNVYELNAPIDIDADLDP